MLDVDLIRLGDEVDSLVASGADRLQWDVMGGRFVLRLTHAPTSCVACAVHRHPEGLEAVIGEPRLRTRRPLAHRTSRQD